MWPQSPHPKPCPGRLLNLLDGSLVVRKEQGCVKKLLYFFLMVYVFPSPCEGKDYNEKASLWVFKQRTPLSTASLAALLLGKAAVVPCPGGESSREKGEGRLQGGSGVLVQ